MFSGQDILFWLFMTFLAKIVSAFTCTHTSAISADQQSVVQNNKIINPRGIFTESLHSTLFKQRVSKTNSCKLFKRVEEKSTSCLQAWKYRPARLQHEAAAPLPTSIIMRRHRDTGTEHTRYLFTMKDIQSFFAINTYKHKLNSYSAHTAKKKKRPSNIFEM